MLPSIFIAKEEKPMSGFKVSKNRLTPVRGLMQLVTLS